MNLTPRAMLLGRGGKTEGESIPPQWRHDNNWTLKRKWHGCWRT